MPQQRKLSYFVATSMDGFIAGPDGGDPSGWWPMTDDYIDFIRSEYPETLPGPAREALGVTGPGHHFDTVIEGRRSFELGLAAGLSDAYPHLRHLVVSASLDSIGESDVELVREDPVQRIRELKAESGKGIWLVGGRTLASSLRSEIDEVFIKLGPVTLGAGVPLWGAESGFHKEVWARTEVRTVPRQKITAARRYTWDGTRALGGAEVVTVSCFRQWCDVRVKCGYVCEVLYGCEVPRARRLCTAPR